MKRWLLAVLALSATALVAAPKSEQAVPQLIEVRKIWDAGEHNAFTDLIWWHNNWWCTFRESAGHVGGDGKIRVLISPDGGKWDSAALVEEKDIDLRDPKFSVTPDDRLMIVCGGSVYLGTKDIKGKQPRVIFSRDGHKWTNPQRISEEGEWLWRASWHNGTVYSVSPRTASYQNGQPAAPKSGEEWYVNLFKSPDGLKWELVSPLPVPGRPNETTVRVLANGDMLAMVRREAGNKMGWFGVARAPFTQWTWHESNYRFGGPNFIQLPNGVIVAGSRDYTQLPDPNGRSNDTSKKARTMLAWVKPGTYALDPFVILPSAGDNSYTGLVWRDDVLWVSYYSTHEGSKTSIFLAKVKMPLSSTPSAK